MGGLQSPFPRRTLEQPNSLGGTGAGAGGLWRWALGLQSGSLPRPGSPRHARLASQEEDWLSLAEQGQLNQAGSSISLNSVTQLCVPPPQLRAPGQHPINRGMRQDFTNERGFSEATESKTQGLRCISRLGSSSPPTWTPPWRHPAPLSWFLPSQ